MNIKLIIVILMTFIGVAQGKTPEILSQYGSIGMSYYNNTNKKVLRRYSESSMIDQYNYIGKSEFNQSINHLVEAMLLIKNRSFYLITDDIKYFSELVRDKKVKRKQIKHIATGIIITLEALKSRSIGQYEEMNSAQILLITMFFRDFMWSYEDRDNLFAITLHAIVDNYPSSVIAYLLEYQRKSSFKPPEPVYTLKKGFSLPLDKKENSDIYMNYTYSFVCGSLHLIRKKSEKNLNSYHNAFSDLNQTKKLLYLLFNAWEIMPSNLKCKVDLVKYLLKTENMSFLARDQKEKIKRYVLNMHIEFESSKAESNENNEVFKLKLIRFYNSLSGGTWICIYFLTYIFAILTAMLRTIIKLHWVDIKNELFVEINVLAFMKYMCSSLWKEIKYQWETPHILIKLLTPILISLVLIELKVIYDFDYKPELYINELPEAPYYTPPYN